LRSREENNSLVERKVGYEREDLTIIKMSLLFGNPTKVRVENVVLSV